MADRGVVLGFDLGITTGVVALDVATREIKEAAVIWCGDADPGWKDISPSRVARFVDDTGVILTTQQPVAVAFEHIRSGHASGNVFISAASALLMDQCRGICDAFPVGVSTITKYALPPRTPGTGRWKREERKAALKTALIQRDFYGMELLFAEAERAAAELRRLTLKTEKGRNRPPSETDVDKQLENLVDAAWVALTFLDQAEGL